MSKSNNFSQFKYKTGGTSKSGGQSSARGGSAGGGPKKIGGFSGPGMMPVPQPKRSFLSGGGHYLG